MCDAIVAHDAVALMAEVQYFWGAEWPIANVARPFDSQPLRLALKACLLERMSEVWNAPPKNEPSLPPDWCVEIQPLTDEFSVVSDEYRHSFAVESPVFRRRNAPISPDVPSAILRRNFDEVVKRA